MLLSILQKCIINTSKNSENFFNLTKKVCMNYTYLLQLQDIINHCFLLQDSISVLEQLERPNLSCVTNQRSDAFASIQIPYFYCLVKRCTCEHVISKQFKRTNIVIMTSQSFDAFASIQIPYFQRLGTLFIAMPLTTIVFATIRLSNQTLICLRIKSISNVFSMYIYFFN